MRSFIKNSTYDERAFYGPSFDDRVAAGIAGLMNAIEKYNLASTVLASRLNAQPMGAAFASRAWRDCVSERRPLQPVHYQGETYQTTFSLEVMKGLGKA